MEPETTNAATAAVNESATAADSKRTHGEGSANGEGFQVDTVSTRTLSRSMSVLDPGEDLARALTQDDESGAVELTIPVSSEYPVERDFGMGPGLEVLEHTEAAVDLERFRDGAAVVAQPTTGGNAHWDGILVGATRGAWVGEDRRLYARLRFASTEDALREVQLIREGIRRNVSIRYRIRELYREPGRNGAPDTFRVTRWVPVHCALCNDPEDPTVGFGREAQDETRTTVYTAADPIETNPSPLEGQAMTDERNTSAQEPSVQVRSTEPAPQATQAATVDREAIRRQIIQDQAEIRRIGRNFGRADLAERSIEQGHTLDQFKNALLDSAPRGGALNAQDDPAHLDMGRQDTRKYSFFRALRYLENPRSPQLADEAGLELEASRAIADATGQEPRGLFVPTDILRDQSVDLERLDKVGLLGHATHARALRGMMRGQVQDRANQSVGNDAGLYGGATVQTDVLAASFIDVLRNTSAILPRCTNLTGLQGNVSIPGKGSTTAGSWIGTEGADTAQDDIAIVGTDLVPHDVGAHVIITRRLLLQSSVDMENLVRMDLAAGIATAFDYAAINGSGNAPTGFLQKSIGDVALAVDAAPTWAEVVALWKLVAEGNALTGDLGWLANAAHVAYFLSTEKTSGNGRYMMETRDSLLGYPVVVSEQMPSNAHAFLNFRDILAGFWGGLDILVDPYSQSKSASILIRAIQTADTNIRHLASAAAWQDSLVT